MLLNKVSDELDIIVIAGQSNAEGYGIGPTVAPYRPSSDILIMRDTDNQGYVVDEKTVTDFAISMPRDYLINIAEERCSTSGKIGSFALYFAEKYRSEFLSFGRRVLVIQSAVGATGFAKGHWGLDGVLYRRLVEMVTLALGMNPKNRVVALLWHQGEHDAVFRPELSDSEREELHLNNLSSLLLDFRGRFGSLPFIGGGFVEDWAKGFERSAAIESATKKLALDHPLVGFASSEGLPSNNQTLGNKDAIHFSRDSLRLLGERYFEIYKFIK